MKKQDRKNKADKKTVIVESKNRKKTLSVGQIESDILNVLQGTSGKSYIELEDRAKWSRAPIFPWTFKAVKPENCNSAPVILEIKKDNTASIVNIEYVAGKLKEWAEAASECDFLFREYNKPTKFFNDCVKAWMHRHQDLSEMPKSVAMLSDPEIALHRNNFDPIACTVEGLKEKAPIFHEMLSRIKTNRDGFCQRIGSIFDPNAHRKQGLWLWGKADAGKSSFTSLLQYAVGKYASCSMNSGTLNGDFWRDQLVGKRVALISEASSWFIRSNDYKDITGDSHHVINPKYGKIYEAKVETMFFFFSNKAPELPSDDSLFNRIIDCEIESIPAEKILPENEVREGLIKELPYILGYCKSKYEEIFSGRSIPVNQESLQEISEGYEYQYHDFADTHIKQVSEEEYKNIPHQQKVTPCDLIEGFINSGMPKGSNQAKEVQNFKRFIQHHFQLSGPTKIPVGDLNKNGRIRVWKTLVWTNKPVGIITKLAG